MKNFKSLDKLRIAKECTRVDMLHAFNAALPNLQDTPRVPMREVSRCGYTPLTLGAVILPPQ